MPVRILLIDDNPDDRALAARELRAQIPGCSVKEIGSKRALTQALKPPTCDLAITDYHLPWTDGLQVLRLVRNRYPNCPVILYTGTGNEQVAVRALKEGADDYVIKTSGRSPQLVMASRLALDRGRQREAARQAETRFRSFAETLPIGYLQVGIDGILLDANPHMTQLLGYPDREALLADRTADFFETTKARKEFWGILRSQKVLDGYEQRLRRKDNSLVWCRFFAHPCTTADGKEAFEAVVENIQLRKDSQRLRSEQEQEIRRAHESLQTVLEAAPMPIIGVNRSGAVDFVWNKAAEQLLEVTRAEAFEKSILELIPEMAPKTKQFFTAITDPATAGGKVMVYTRRDGCTLHLSLHVSPLHDPDGKQAGVIAVLMDITERKRTEDALRLSENRLSLIHESVSEMLILLGVETDGFRVVLVNRAVCERFQRPSESVVGRRLDELLPSPLSANIAAKCREVRQHRKPISFASSTRLPGPGRLTTQNNLIPILDSGNRCTHILLVARDTHDRIHSDIEIRRAMHALRESEYRYRALAEAAHDMIFILSREERVVYVNSYCCSMFRQPAEKIVGIPLASLFPAAVAALQSATLRTVFESGEPAYREQLITFPAGDIWLGTWLVPMRDSSGNVLSVLGVSRDITERMRAEQALRESEEQYRSLVQTSPDAILLHDPEARISYANQQALELLGYSSQEEVHGTYLLDLVLPEERPSAERNLRTLMQSGSLRNVVHTLRRRDGTTVPVEINASLILEPQGRRTKAIVGILRDITERRRREEALLKSEAQFRALFEKAATGVVLLNRERRMIECNDALCEILDRSHEELLGIPLAEITHVEDRDADRDLAGNILNGELDHYRLEKRLLRKDGSVAWCRLTVSAVRGAKKELRFLAGMIEDISKQREAEQANLQANEDLRRYADRLETLHEIDRAIQLAETPEAIAFAALKRIAGLVPCQRSSLILFDHPNRTVTILNVNAPIDTELRKGRILSFAEYGADIETLKAGKVYAVEDLLSREDLSPAFQQLRKEGIRSLLSVPLITQEELLGALNIASGIPGGFTREHAEIAGEVAGLLAVAIQQSRLLLQVRRHAMELESITALNYDLRLAQTRGEMNDILLRHISKALLCDFVGLLALDPSTGELFFEKVSGAFSQLEGSRLDAGAGINGKALADNKPFRHNKPGEIRDTAYRDVIQKMRALACVPLIARGHTIGALWIGRSPAAPESADITDDDMRLLISIGDVAANAIHRATLHRQTERRLRRLAALRAVDMAISASIDLRVTLSVLLDQVTAQLEVDAGNILILNLQTQILSNAVSRGLPTTDKQQNRLLGQGFAGMAALERRVVSIPRLEENEDPNAQELRTGVNRFSSYFAAPLIAKGQVRGVLELFSRTAMDPDPEWLEYLETMAAQAAIAIDNSSMFEHLQRSHTDLVMAYDATIEGWAHTLELRDRETHGHAERVTDTSIRLARAMGIREADLVHIRRGALMHDIGKMAIPDSILQKPGPLTEKEWGIMRTHPIHAYDLLSPITYLRPALDIPYCHHEKWDGSGYPRGLKGEQIPLAARVFAVVDVWDALLSDRPYRRPWPKHKAYKYLREQSGKHFDPAVVDAFFRIIGT